MRAAIVVFPGSNREPDAAAALEAVSGKRPALVWHRDTELPEVDLVVLPGGFAHGDYLRTGAIAAHAPIMGAVRRAAERGVHVLGICNGFQILTEAGLLPGVLLRNASLKFVCRDVHLRVETTDCAYTGQYQRGQVLNVPVAHADGNYFADPATVKSLEDGDRIAFRYAEPTGELSDFANPNGSLAGIAGILGPNRRVLGLMPHPEDAVIPRYGSTDGRGMFESLVAALG